MLPNMCFIRYFCFQICINPKNGLMDKYRILLDAYVFCSFAYIMSVRLYVFSVHVINLFLFVLVIVCEKTNSS